MARTAPRTRWWSSVLRGLRWGMASVAVLLAVIPFVGWASPTLDAFGSFLPLAPPLVIVALLLGGRRPGWFVPLATLYVLVASAIVMVPEGFGSRAPPEYGGGERVVIVSHNVGFPNGDPETTIRELGATDADILLLQETDGSIAPYLDELRSRFPYSNECRHRCSLAIFSRLPLDRVRYRFRDEKGDPFGPSLIWTQAHLANGWSFPIATVHLPWPLPAERQARWREALVSAVAKVDRHRLVLAGDFNLTPWSDAMAKLDQGLYPMRRGTRALFSFPARLDGAPAPFPLLPIDHLFAGAGWTVVSASRLPGTGSDHYPIRLELVWRGTTSVIPSR